MNITGTLALLSFQTIIKQRWWGLDFICKKREMDEKNEKDAKPEGERSTVDSRSNVFQETYWNS